MQARSNHPNLTGVRSLVVEDEPVVANTLRRLLASVGALVSIAPTAAKARSALDQDAEWRLILLDQKLPDGDGLDLLDRIESLSPRPALVAVSGFLQESKRALRLQAFRAMLLPKPFDRDDLFSAVSDAFTLAARSGRTERTEPPQLGKSGEYLALLNFGPITAHLVTQTVSVSGAHVELQPAQFRILAQMLANPGRSLSVAELVEGALRGSHCNGSSNIRFQIHALRRRLGAAGKLVERRAGGYGVGLNARNHWSGSSAAAARPRSNES